MRVLDRPCPGTCQAIVSTRHLMPRQSNACHFMDSFTCTALIYFLTSNNRWPALLDEHCIKILFLTSTDRGTDKLSYLFFKVLLIKKKEKRKKTKERVGGDREF